MIQTPTQGRHTAQARRGAPDPSYLTLPLSTTSPYHHNSCPSQPIMSSDYEISDEENEYYDEEDDDMDMEVHI